MLALADIFADAQLCKIFVHGKDGLDRTGVNIPASASRFSDGNSLIRPVTSAPRKFGAIFQTARDRRRRRGD